MEPLYEIRGATLGDEEQILAIARHLNTVNLPHEREGVQQILESSQQSFEGVLEPNRRQYVFVLVDRAKDRIIGTSMIFGQLGRKDAPYIYLDVTDEERYSATLDKHFKHTVLSIGYSYDGPTEIGGLVLHPDYRRVPERLGTFLSYVRFLFLKMHREAFRDEVLAELLPPLEADGTSHLWDALGRHFMDMSYEEADKLSRRNKEFIRGLFPEGSIYASLLPKEAQAVIGKVGAQTRGVEKLLRRIGFRYAERVDPFDGGPHFTAPTDEITLVKATQHLNIRQLLPPGTRVGRRGLVAVEMKDPPWFRAVLSPLTSVEDGAAVGGGEAKTLGVQLGDEVWVLPLD
ncbi:MAG: arginine N-succinyltransferase [Labilithrix sp.]|nr:arginine N-succinyltransferase [Labilithrix sp.]MCW5818230.1 arginine N-succinyltransferase [Labilithrix sp.]